ncbi:GMC family oxidoreductase [Hymenobacter sp. 15J16-1T3B]|uniref:GMC family oxidoreductase n=1 Tax=Hymenobacter sp. 15J16-1T3B TaxID=2886941 RepID=UPI001D114E8B|nr:GMC family oxidoreductase [Hymenobacter sp. 15J16-1T3B]MCC3156270.1 GMC family oxidoreductase [Hymenobacter sp. 15J16-1T3B]
MPDEEELLEEGVVSPVQPDIQDPLLRKLLKDEPAAADTPQPQPAPLPEPGDEVDCVVIGTGAGGAPLLARLAMAGLKVVALEAGPRHAPRRDFATDEQAQAFLFWNDERLSAGKDPLSFGNNNSGTGVGGSTLHYTAYTPRVQPDDLRLRTEFGVGQDWPLGYDDLAPYYDELEWLLGISGPSPYPWGPARQRGYPLPPLPLNGAAQLMQRACEKLGIRTSPAANAAVSARYYQEGIGWREACTNRGFCQAGCSNGAKASMDVTFIPLAEAHGAEVRADCFVTEIERDAQGRVTGVVYQQHGQTRRQRCRTLFLCAGAVETPRLLLLNKLALSSGHVGRNLMAHPGLQLWGTFDEMVRPYKGIPGGLISEDTHRPRDADFAGGYLLQSIGVMPVTFASQVARGRGLWGAGLREYLQQYNHVAGINILGDCLPHADNYLELSDEKDSRGLPKPRVYFTNQENEQRMNAHAERTMRRIWEAAGARDIWTFPRSAHVIGTCRMGRSGDDAVVDADGRCFDVPNLYICDNSVFPSALSVNPALTIMALSLRTADRFLEQQQRRDS